VSQGEVDCGFTFFVQERKPRYTCNYVADQHFQIVSDDGVPAARHARRASRSRRLASHSRSRGREPPGTITLFVDGKPAGRES
jgi:hypothetical protein